MSVSEFLLARITEDEEVAREALDVAHDWLVEDNSIGLWPDDREPPDGYMRFPRRAHARHAAYWSPARVTAECVFKREIVRLWNETEEGTYGDQGPTVAAEAAYALAAVYADHPDYDEAWRP